MITVYPEDFTGEDYGFNLGVYIYFKFMPFMKLLICFTTGGLVMAMVYLI